MKGQMKGHAMYSSDAKWTNPGLALIKANDPDTYNRMTNCDWKVQVISNPDDVLEIVESIIMYYDIRTIIDFYQGVLSAFGTTIQGDNNPPELLYHTFLNRKLIENVASGELNVPVTDFLADVMVHEFKHREGYGEDQAFDAGTDFAVKLGDESLAQFSRDTKITEIAQLGE